MSAPHSSGVELEMIDPGDRAPGVWHPSMQHSFDYEPMPPKPPRRRGAKTRGLFAATSTKIADIAPPPTAPPPPANNKVWLPCLLCCWRLC